MYKKKYIKLAIIASLIIIFDQITKAVILNNLALYQNITVIPGFFNITHIHNPGGAFGVFAEHSSSWRKIIFLIVSFLAVGLVLYFHKKTPESYPFLTAAFALIFGGAMGNLIDRVRFGKVVDFLDFYIGNWHWPAFNVADSAISVGVVVFLIHIVLNKVPE